HSLTFHRHHHSCPTRRSSDLSALRTKRPDWALTWTSVTAGSWENASRTEASHPPQLIPWTTNSLVCIPMLLSDILATVPYTPIGYISMDGVLGILPFQDGHREGSQCEMTFVP